MSTGTTTEAAVKERPIIFSAPMVNAILAGRKTQTRRVIKPQPPFDLMWAEVDEDGYIIARPCGEFPARGGKPCPYGKPGDRLWARETWQHVYRTYDGQCLTSPPDKACVHFIEYAATVVDGEHPPRWRSPIHMPRWASRITLEITGVRVERVQDIGEFDAFWEGVDYPTPPDGLSKNETLEWLSRGIVDEYAKLWDRIHGAGAWDRNDWVWVVEFRRIGHV